MGEETYLLTARDIAAMEGVRKTHFINPDARRLNKSLGDAAGLTGIGFHLIEVEPGHSTTEHHLHHHEDECLYVLEGHATALIGEEAFPIGPGDFIGYRKGGLAHSITNTGTGVLRCIVAGERAGHDVCDYPRLGKRLFRNPGLPWNMVDMDAIGQPGGGAGRK